MKWITDKRNLLFLLYALAFAFPFGYAITPKIIYTWIALSVIFFIKNYTTFSKQDIRDFFSHSIWFFLITLFLTISVFYSKNTLYALDSLWQKLLLVLIPFSIFITLKLNPLFSFKNTLKYFVYGNVTAILLCIVIAVIRSISFSNGHFDFDIYLSGAHLDINSLRPNYFTYTIFSRFIHPSYFSLYIVFAIAILLFYKNDIFKQKDQKYYIVIFIAILILGVLLASSRAGIISLIILFLFYIVSFKGKYAILLRLGLVLVLILGIAFSYRTARLHYIVLPITKAREITESLKKDKVVDIYSYTGNRRIAVWYASYLLSKENFPFGVGIGDIRYDLQVKYNSLGLSEDANDRLNAHNQFLEIFLQSGILGLLSLLLLFIEGFYLAFKNKNKLFGFLLVIILLNFMVESMLSRLYGISFVVFFSFLFVIELRQKHNKILK